jgi:hypothetical protein
VARGTAERQCGRAGQDLGRVQEGGQPGQIRRRLLLCALPSPPTMGSELGMLCLAIAVAQWLALLRRHNGHRPCHRSLKSKSSNPVARLSAASVYLCRARRAGTRHGPVVPGFVTYPMTRHGASALVLRRIVEAAGRRRQDRGARQAHHLRVQRVLHEHAPEVRSAGHVGSHPPGVQLRQARSCLWGASSVEVSLW